MSPWNAWSGGGGAHGDGSLGIEGSVGVDATVRTIVDTDGTETGAAISTGGIFGDNTNGGGMLDEAASATNPTLVPDRADLDTGWGAVPATADVLVGIAGGVEGFHIAESGSAITLTGAGALTVTGGVFGANAAGAGILDEAASATNPTVIPNKADLDTGWGSAAADQLSGVAGGTEVVRLSEAGAATSTQFIVSPGAVLGDVATPALAFGDGASGFTERVDNEISISLNGVERFRYAGQAYHSAVGGATLRNETASATNPTVCPTLNDSDSGLGSNAADSISFIAGGVEGIRLTENTGVLQTVQINTGLTADTGSAQGGTPLTSSYNVIATCANAGDSVTLPAAAAGQLVTIINNGAESADVFPASGDDCGAGANAAVALAAGSDVTYLAIDDTNWEDIT